MTGLEALSYVNTRLLPRRTNPHQASSYAVLPLAKLYKPIWEYDRKTLAKDLSAHLAYGLATAAAFRLLTA